MTVVNMKNKKTQKGVIKRQLKFENYKIFLEATQLENKINHLENHKGLIKNNKSILKMQQSFKCERLKVFTEEIHKIDLTSNVDKIMQLIDSMETCIWNKRTFIK